jgi:serine/threonine protein phosphatase PrpC
LLATGKSFSTWIDARSESPESHRLPFGEVIVYSASSPARPERNEDAAAVGCRGGDGILLVSDGAGGVPGGATAARAVVETMVGVLQRPGDDGTRAAVLDGIEAAHSEVMRRTPGSMATVAAMLVGEDEARSITVGDSMCLVVGGRGKIKYRSIAHGPVGFAEEAGVISEREAMTHEDRHLVSNMLGLDEMRIEVGSRFKLAARDTLLVASDGLFDNLYLREIAECVRSGPLQHGVARLVERSRARMQRREGPGKPDDLTIVACRSSS